MCLLSVALQFLSRKTMSYETLSYESINTIRDVKAGHSVRDRLCWSTTDDDIRDMYV